MSSPRWESGNKACTGGFSEAATSPGPSEFLCLFLPRTGEPDEEEGTFRSSIRREFGDTAGFVGQLFLRTPLLGLRMGLAESYPWLQTPPDPRTLCILLRSVHPQAVEPPPGSRKLSQVLQLMGGRRERGWGRGLEGGKGQSARVGAWRGELATHSFHPRRAPLAPDTSLHPAARL